MKKAIFLFLLCMMSLCAFSQHPYHYQGTPIEMKVYAVDPYNLGFPFPKSPTPEAPEASIDDHTLYLYGVDYDLTLYLLDEDGDDVYTVFIPANTASVVLPSTLTGDYELQLYTDGLYYFSGYVEL